MPWNVTADPDERDRAVAWLRARVAVTDDEYARLSEDMRQRSFTIGGTQQLRVVQTVLSEIRRSVERGEADLDAFKERVRERLKSRYVDKNSARLQAAFNTTTQLAYSQGRYEALTEAEEELPYLIYDAVLDARTSPLCRRLNGTVLRADHLWWRTHWPPCHVNCRSSVRALGARQARKHGITRVATVLKPEDGFGLSPDQRPVWEPDAADFDPRAFAEFRTKLAVMRSAARTARRINR